MRKISTRSAWVCAKASLTKPPKKREGRERGWADIADSDYRYNPSVITVFEDETDPLAHGVAW